MKAEDSTPEWFQMAQADGFEPKPTSKRMMRIMALATPLFVLGAGLVFAQTQDSPTAVASGLGSTVSTSATPSADPISLSTTPSATAPVTTTAATSNAVAISQASSVTPSAKASITIKKPAITMPTGGGEDERDSDDD